MKKLFGILMTAALVLTMSVPAFAGTGLTEKEALKTALKNAGLEKSQVKAIEVELDEECYEVEFTKKKGKTEYDYSISEKSGKIMEKSVEYRVKKNTSHKKIGKKAARKVVSKASGISTKVIKKGTCQYKYKKQGKYEVEFAYKGKVYDYEVQAATGKILEYEWERK